MKYEMNETLINELIELLQQDPYKSTYLGMFKDHFIEWFKLHIDYFDDFEQIKGLISVTFNYIKRDNNFVEMLSRPQRIDETKTRISQTRTELINKLENIKETLENLYYLQTPETKQLLSLIEKFKEDPTLLIPEQIKVSKNREEIIKYLNMYPLTTKDKQSYFEAIASAKRDREQLYKDSLKNPPFNADVVNLRQ